MVDKIIQKIEELQTQQHVIAQQLHSLQQQLQTAILNCKMYHPINELTTLAGNRYREIALVFRDDNKLYTRKIIYPDILEVTDSGYLYISDYILGIYEWNDKEQTYEHHYWGRAFPIDIIGFYNLDCEEFPC